jgi:hypothetical protein
LLPLVVDVFLTEFYRMRDVSPHSSNHFLNSIFFHRHILNFKLRNFLICFFNPH